MIRYLIKNNIKLMLRNPTNILLFVVIPVVVSAVLISAFSSLLESYECDENFDVGYTVAEGSPYENAIDAIKEIGDKNGVKFIAYSAEDITSDRSTSGDNEGGVPPVRSIMENNNLAGFVEIGEDSYKVYKTEEKKSESAKLEYIVSTFFNSLPLMSGMAAPSQNDPSETVNHSPSINESSTDAAADDFPSVIEADHSPAINSTDYYGIVFLVYISWCAIVCGAGLFTNEKKNCIIERLQVSNLSILQVYLARMIPIVSVVILGTGISMLLSVLVLGVHWGNIALSALIVMLMVLAATAFEMMIYEITNSMLATIILSFGIVWFMGFVGGTFETYMFSSVPETVKQLSPLYHENRALTELSSMGHSDYVISALLYPVTMTIISSIISLFAGRIRRFGK